MTAGAPKTDGAPNWEEDLFLYSLGIESDSPSSAFLSFYHSYQAKSPEDCSRVNTFSSSHSNPASARRRPSSVSSTSPTVSPSIFPPPSVASHGIRRRLDFQAEIPAYEGPIPSAPAPKSSRFPSPRIPANKKPLHDT